MKLKNNNSGVSMLTLVITIVVIIILALVAFAASTRTVDEANYSTYVNNVSEVGTFFEDTSVKMHGSEMLKDNTKRDEQIYNYVAKGGSGEADFLHVTALPDYTIIEDNADIGINLPKVKVESGTGKMVPIKYASTKNGQIFTWPPYEHNGELWITPNDTVESKMQTAIQVGEEFFTIEIDYRDGTLIGAKPNQNTPSKPNDKEDPEGTETPGGSNTPGGTENEGGSGNQDGTENENGSQNNSGDTNNGGSNNSGNTGNGGSSNNPGGSSNTPDTPSHQHDFSAKSETSTYLVSEASCISPTKYYYKCTGCSEKGTSTYTSGKALGHDFKGQDPADKYLASEASCVLQPKYYFKCVRCDAKGTETYASGTPLGHDYGDFKIDKPANCKEEGQRSQTCTRCFGTETEKIPVDSNNHVGGKSSKTETEATCTSAGSKKTICNGCNAVLGSESIKSLGHSYTAKVGDNNFKASDATCTEGAKYYFKCSRCSSKGTDTYVSGDALGHDYKDVVTDATCKDKGYTTHTCEKCKDVVVDSYTETGDHSWSEWEVVDGGTCTVSEIQSRKCNVCGGTETNEIPAAGHKWEVDSIVEATCLVGGYTRYVCENCSEVKDEDYTDALEHDYEIVVTAPTCTEKGYTTFDCIRCEDEYDDLYVNATGHAWGDWMEITPGTCTTEGENGRKCGACGLTETQSIAAPGHNFGEPEVYLEATCIQAGELRKTCGRCGEFQSEYTDVNPDNHKNISTEIKTQPKCTTTGIQTITCHDCDIVLEEQVIDALEHDFTVEVQEDEFIAAEANCTTGKTYYYQCSRCEEKSTETYEVGEALGHEFGEPTFNWAADHCSCKAVFECIRGDKKQEIACGMKIDVLKEVSCEESGEHLYTATATFEEKTYVEEYLDIVPPQGHQYGDPNFNVSNESGFIHAEQECPCGKIHSTDVNIQGEVVNKEPTCSDSGSKDVTVSVTIGDKTYTETITVVTPPKGHEGETEFIWSDNYTKATAIFRCSCGDEQTATATVSVTGTRLPTCTQAGYTQYTATAEFEGETFSENYTLWGEPLGHSLNAPVFTWAADNKSATVTVTCAHGDFVETEKAAMSTSTPVPALCETEGVLRYTAAVRVNNVYYSEYRDFTIPPTGHTGSTEFDWADDYTTATAIFTCNCGSIKTAEAEIESERTKEPTCTEVGEMTHTATAVIDEITYTDTKTSEIEALGHTYGEPTFIWVESNKDADATVTCQVCGYEETMYTSIKVETITTTTCDTDGLKKYIASVTVNEIEYSEEREVVIEAYNHSKTKIVGQTEDYTGDVVCVYCGTILEKGHGPQVKALLLADNSLVFVKDMTTYSYGDAYEDTTISHVYKGMDQGSYFTNSYVPWDSQRTNIKKVIVKDAFAPESTDYWFSGFTRCTTYDVTRLDMSNVTSMVMMFRNNTSLTNIDVSGWNTANVTNMQYVFSGCSKLQNIVGLGDWDVSKVTDMYEMFYNCSTLTTIEGIGNWRTTSIERRNSIFSGMTNLRELDLTNWTGSKYAAGMFDDCIKLEKITVGSSFYFHSDGRLPDVNYTNMPGIAGSWYVLDELSDPTREYFSQYGNNTIPGGRAETYVLAVYYVNYDNITDATFDPHRTALYSPYSPDIPLINPTREGSEFIGWTGNGITTPTLTAYVPAGSRGTLEYTANWEVRYTAPKGRVETYNGSAKPLTSGGSAKKGTMYYRIGTDGEWSTTPPTAINAGTYSIYYYVSASEGYEETPVYGPITATIRKASGSITTPPRALTLEYNGTYQKLVTEGAYGTGAVRYKVGDDGYWSTSIPTARNAGEYKIYYSVAAGDNHYETDSLGYVTTIINKTNPTITTEPTGLELRYNGEYQNLITRGYASIGTIYYRVGNSTEWNTAIPTARDNGTYEIYYYIAEGTNCNASEVMGPITATITGYPGQITPPGALNLTYTGEPQVLVTPATSTTGTVYYKVGGTGTWSTELPTGTNAGTYRIYYYASESGDYIETSRSVYVTSTISKDETEDPGLENCTVKYNQPYVLEFGTVCIDFIFREDGSAEVWFADEEGLIISGDYISMQGNQVTIAMDSEPVTATVSANGSQLTIPIEEDGMTAELSLNLREVEHQPVRFGQEYIGTDNSGNTLKGIVYEDGSGVMYINDTATEFPAGYVTYSEHSFNMGGVNYPIYPDGSRVMVDGYILSVRENVIRFGEKYSAAMGDAKMSIVMYEDGSCDVYQNDELVQNMPAGSLSYTYNTIIAPPSDIIGNTDYMEIPVSRDGCQIIINVEDEIIKYGLVLEDMITPVLMDEWYVGVMELEEMGYFVPHADGSIDVYDLNFTLMEHIPYGVVYGANNTINFMQMIGSTSADGKTISIVPIIFECKWIKNDSPLLEGTPIVCNQPYFISGDDFSEELIFREDGSLEIWTNIGFGIQVSGEDVVVEGTNITITIDGEVTNATVSESGDKITLAGGMEFTLTRVRQGDFRYGRAYSYSDGTNYIEGTIYEDGSALLNENGYTLEIPMNGVVIEDHLILVNGMEITIHPDGTKVMYDGIILETSDSALKFGEKYSLCLLGMKATVIFYRDGSYDYIENGKTETFPANSFQYTYNQIIFDENQTEGIGSWSKTFTISNDGAVIIMDDMYQDFEMGLVLESNETAVKFNRPYAQIDNGEITGYVVMHSDGKTEQYNADGSYNIVLEYGIIYGQNNNVSFAMAAIGTVSSDGKYITIVEGQLEFELVEFGMYLGRIYEGTDAEGVTWQYKFYLDGSFDVYRENVYQIRMPAGSVEYGESSITIGGVTYAVSADGKSFTAEGITCYAAEDGVYYVTYQSGTADDAMEFPNGKVSTYTQNSSDITLIEPTKEGLEFRGWVLEQGDEPVKNMVIPAGSKGDKHFIAVWKTAGTSIVDLIYDDGVTANTEIEATTSADLPTPTRAGYTFDGWYLYEAVAGEKELTTFTNPNANYAWTKDANGVWSSGNSKGNYHSTKSSMLSEEFTIGADGGTISFDWKSYAEGYCDYLGYDILNVETGEYLSGNTTPTHQNCIANLRENNSNTYTTVSHTLQEGTYKILFVYGKDGSVDSNDDKGYVKNIVVTGTLIEEATTPVPETITEDITVIAKWTAN